MIIMLGYFTNDKRASHKPANDVYTQFYISSSFISQYLLALLTIGYWLTPVVIDNIARERFCR